MRRIRRDGKRTCLLHGELPASLCHETLLDPWWGSLFYGIPYGPNFPDPRSLWPECHTRRCSSSSTGSYRRACNGTGRVISRRRCPTRQSRQATDRAFRNAPLSDRRRGPSAKARRDRLELSRCGDGHLRDSILTGRSNSASRQPMGRISISDGAGIGLGQRFTHSTASSMFGNSQSQ